MDLLTLFWGCLAGTPSLVWQCLTVVIYDSGFRKLLYYYLLSFGLSEASFDSHHHIVHCRHSFLSIEIDTSGNYKKIGRKIFPDGTRGVGDPYYRLH